MRGTKWGHVLKGVEKLVGSLEEKDLISTIIFDEDPNSLNQKVAKISQARLNPERTETHTV